MLSSCSLTKYQISETRDYCSAKYPIVLVHGIAVRDKMLIRDFWGEIPDILEKEGALVFTGQQKAWDTVAENGQILKETVNSILAKTGAAKVNIIAHSKGGLEARYLISKLGMADKVASLTTICTPHRGSAIANIAYRYVKSPFKTGILEANFWGKLISDEDSDSFKAVADLTTDFLQKFNKEVPDIEGVYYQSYGAAIGNRYPNPYWRLVYEVLYESEDENDGVVSVESCKWGEFRGIVQSDKGRGVRHLDIVGRTAFSGVDDFDAPVFFVKIVNELKNKGF